MLLGYARHNGETESTAFDFLPHQSMKPLPGPISLGRRYARAIVTDRETDLARDRTHRYQDLPTGRAVAHGVVYQIAEQDAQEVGITQDPGIPAGLQFELYALGQGGAGLVGAYLRG